MHHTRPILLILLCALPAFATPTDAIKSTIRQTCKAAEIVSYMVWTHLALAVAHEAGHVLAAKAACHYGAELSPKSSGTISLEPLNYGICPTATYPTYQNTGPNLLVTMAGPALGFSAIYSFLKSYNIYLEYQKHTNLKKAFIDGFKKNLINDDQNSAVRAAINFNLCSNIAMMVPFKINSYKSHGYDIIQLLSRLNLKEKNNQ